MVKTKDSVYLKNVDENHLHYPLLYIPEFTICSILQLSTIVTQIKDILNIFSNHHFTESQENIVLFIFADMMM